MPTRRDDAPHVVLDRVIDAMTDELLRQEGHRWIDSVTPAAAGHKDQVFIFDAQLRLSHLLRAIVDVVGTGGDWRSLYIALRSVTLDPPPPRDPARKPRPRLPRK